MLATGLPVRVNRCANPNGADEIQWESILNGMKLGPVCLLSVALAWGQAAPQTQPKAPAAQEAHKPQMAEDVYKNIRLLRGLPVDEFLDTMGFFSASTNLNCTDLPRRGRGRRLGALCR